MSTLDDLFDGDLFDPYGPNDLDDEDGIQCRRCGATGLYWQTVTQADGRDDKSRLFDSATKRPHVCTVRGDAFSVEPDRG